MTESVINSPYRGLTPYTEADAAYFFGRTAEIATITANLEVARLTLFYGPSGVGKTSVLRAGVLHGLQEQARTNREALGRPEIIPVYFSGWQGEPLLGLTQQIQAATLQLYQGAPPVPDLLTEPAPPLLSLLAQIGEQTESDLLIVLDQFEEYFLYHPNKSGPDSFAHHFIQAVNSSHLRANFLLSLREDALARLDYFKGRIPALLDNRLSIGHLDRAAGYEAVVKPLERFNQDQPTTYTIEPPLVTAVLDQVGSGQVTLSKQGAGGRTETSADRIEAPYLQLVLTRLWEQEQATGSTCLRQTTLDELGGAVTIVRNYLDDTLDALSSAERDLAARFFDRLVTPSGAKIALSLAELAHYTGGDMTPLAAVIEQLQSKRLLRPVTSPAGVTQYEIFHDVLGPALLDWQTRYQKAQAEEQRLAAAEAERVEAERRAQEAEERARLQAAARQQAQARAEAEARRVRQSRWALAGLSVFLLLLVGAISVTLQARNLADGAKATAQAESTRAIRGEQAANAARATAQTNEEIAKTAAERARQAQATAVANEQRANLEKQRADQRTLEVAKAARSALIENMVGQTQLLIYRDQRVGDQSLILARDAVLMTLTLDGFVPANAYTALRIAVEQARWQRTMPPADQRHVGVVYSAAFDSTGTRIVSSGEDGTIRIWRVPTLDPVAILFGHASVVTAVVWSPDGQRIVSGSGDASVRVWDAKSGKQLVQLDGHADSVWSVAWSPDGQRIVSGSGDDSVRVWDAESGEQLIQLDGHTDSVRSVAWSPDGQRIVSGSWDDSLRVWDIPERLVLRAIARISRPAPILTTAERREFGIADEIQLPGQDLLKPLMVQAHALQLVEQGQALARTGQIPAAVSSFTAAMALDPTLHLAPESLARRILSNTVQALLFAGRQAAQSGQLETALAKLAEAAALQPTLNQAALSTEFRQLAASVTPSPTVTVIATVVATRSPLATPTQRATAVGP